MQSKFGPTLYGLLHCIIFPEGLHGWETFAWECVIQTNIFSS